MVVKLLTAKKLSQKFYSFSIIIYVIFLLWEEFMNRFGPKANKTIQETMRNFKRGKLKSGRSNTPVRDPKQALAIGISKARKKRYKVPPAPNSDSEEKSTNSK
jgi:hypothetical protein